jgi:dihydropyrimidinase
MPYGDIGHRTQLGGLFHAFRRISKLGGVAIIHAENESLIESFVSGIAGRNRATMTSLPASRPPITEAMAILEAAYLAERTGVALHIAHMSSQLGLNAFLRAKHFYSRISAETCPHYLLLDDNAYSRRQGALFSVMPPLRSESDRNALWTSLANRTLALVATDHCLLSSAQKAGKQPLEDLPYGLPGLGLLLPLLYSEGVVPGRISLTDIPRLLSHGPAGVYGLLPRKGALERGADADLVLFDPESHWDVNPETIGIDTDFTPYDGHSVQGEVVATMVRGELVYEIGSFLGTPGAGQFVPMFGANPPDRKTA